MLLCKGSYVRAFVSALLCKAFDKGGELSSMSRGIDQLLNHR
ncbi:hypothetical protein Sbal678_3238 [Shewanella baltica OS678]|nr:hypothetical protein Sbal678_3238 [Shewanella baltica OS678]